MKPSGPGLLFVGHFLITDSISLLVTGLFIFSISSRLYILLALCISVASVVTFFISDFDLGHPPLFS